jgi:hypothetical protein
MPHPQLLMEIESFDLNCIRMMKLLVAARHSHSGCATRANHIVIADLNGDGRPDVSACAEHDNYELHWWRNDGRIDRLNQTKDTD